MTHTFSQELSKPWRRLLVVTAQYAFVAVLSAAAFGLFYYMEVLAGAEFLAVIVGAEFAILLIILSIIGILFYWPTFEGPISANFGATTSHTTSRAAAFKTLRNKRVEPHTESDEGWLQRKVIWFGELCNSFHLTLVAGWVIAVVVLPAAVFQHLAHLGLFGRDELEYHAFWLRTQGPREWIIGVALAVGAISETFKLAKRVIMAAKGVSDAVMRIFRDLGKAARVLDTVERDSEVIAQLNDQLKTLSQQNDVHSRTIRKFSQQLEDLSHAKPENRRKDLG